MTDYFLLDFDHNVRVPEGARDLVAKFNKTVSEKAGEQPKDTVSINTRFGDRVGVSDGRLRGLNDQSFTRDKFHELIAELAVRVGLTMHEVNAGKPNERRIPSGQIALRDSPAARSGITP